MGRYSKPAGYRVLSQPPGYKPFNNFLSGDQTYSPGPPGTYSITYQFVAAPANASQIQVPDGPANQPGVPTKAFTYTYSGSPGAGIIPLVAGGGTAAQAATAAQVALAAQLTYWTAVSTAPGFLTLTRKIRGIGGPPALINTTNMNAVTGTGTAFGPVTVGRVGRIYCILPAA